MGTESTKIIPQNAVHILVTEEDKNGQNLLAMSDFFGAYVQQLTEALRVTAVPSITPDIPVADIGIISEVVQQVEAVTHGTTQLLPDFDHLPKDIRKKLKDGAYKIGASKQVDGNLRAVIVDETDTRVKDVTLKEVRVNAGTLEASRSITNQLQMRQIYEKLDAIQEMQSFQIDRDRDRDLKVPVLDARNYILNAQGDNTSDEDRRKYMEKAADKLLSAVNSLYTDIQTSTNHVLELTNIRIFQKKKQIREYIAFISEDILIVTKVVGLRMQVLDYLGNTDGAQIEMTQYQRFMRDFFTTELPGRGYSAAELIHLNYPYTKNNLDCWFQLRQDMEQVLLTENSKDQEHIYLVSVEEEENDRE